MKIIKKASISPYVDVCDQGCSTLCMKSIGCSKLKPGGCSLGGCSFY